MSKPAGNLVRADLHEGSIRSGDEMPRRQHLDVNDGQNPVDNVVLMDFSRYCFFANLVDLRDDRLVDDSRSFFGDDFGVNGCTKVDNLSRTSSSLDHRLWKRPR
jgi:hypothetical protein